MTGHYYVAPDGPFVVRLRPRSAWRAVFLLALVAVGGCDAAVGGRDAQSRRQEVVRLVQSGELGSPAGEQQAIRLPDEQRDLSDGGEVVVTRWDGRLRVVFFARRGILDQWEGYVWTYDCALDEDPLGGVLYESRAISDCWFYARAN